MERSSKIYLISLLIFGGGILAVLNWGNNMYVTPAIIETAAAQKGLFKNLCQTGKINNTKGHTDEYRDRC